MNLSRSKPLARTEFKRTPRPDRAAQPPAYRAPATRGALATAVAEVLACRDTVASAARAYGCSRTSLEAACRSAFQRAVMKRDGWRCQNCPAPADDVQHRIRRGMGGTCDPRIAFGMCNGVALCRRCHLVAERRDPEMHARGFWLETTQDPEAEPIAAWIRNERAVVWLTADGRRSYKPQAGAA